MYKLYSLDDTHIRFIGSDSCRHSSWTKDTRLGMERIVRSIYCLHFWLLLILHKVTLAVKSKCLRTMALLFAATTSWTATTSVSSVDVISVEITNCEGPGTQIGATAKGGKCNLNTGKCECVSGYSGERCEVSPENSASMGNCLDFVESDLNIV